jgi:phosphopentomutase
MVRRVWARWFPTKKQIKLGKNLERERLGVAKYREKIARLEETYQIRLIVIGKVFFYY